MAEYLIQDTTLDAIADAINAKTGGSSAMTPAQMVTAIGSISGGGGDALESDFLVIRKETVEVGENTVTNMSELVALLSSLKSAAGTMFGFSEHPKDAYQFNEVCSGLSSANAYRYRNGTWSNVPYSSASHDAVLPSGSIYDIYTYEIFNPSTV